MTGYPIYQVDAFSSKLFGGNPAAVCPLQAWPKDDLLQAIAAENNLSETAFFVPRDAGGYELRWFTPVCEVDLCGHATLATSHVLLHELGVEAEVLEFHTRSGRLEARRREQGIALGLPASTLTPVAAPEGLAEALGAEPVAVLDSDDYLVRLESEATVLALEPDLVRLAQFERRGIIVTAPGSDVDFVCRFFAPRVGVNEDPVTGSAFCKLVPYWAKELDRDRLQGRQVSARQGDVGCLLQGDRVELVGECATYLTGELRL